MNKSFIHNNININNKQTNYLLLKDGIGKPRPFTRDLPDARFTYGKALTYDPEGASACIEFDFIIMF
jgi:hypothetical protein